MSIESIVRPFQTPDFAPARPYTVPGTTGAVNVHLIFGRGGGGRTLSGSLSLSQTYYCTAYVNEKNDGNWGTNN